MIINNKELSLSSSNKIEIKFDKVIINTVTITVTIKNKVIKYLKYENIFRNDKISLFLYKLGSMEDKLNGDPI